MTTTKINHDTNDVLPISSLLPSDVVALPLPSLNLVFVQCYHNDNNRINNTDNDDANKNNSNNRNDTASITATTTTIALSTSSSSSTLHCSNNIQTKSIQDWFTYIEMSYNNKNNTNESNNDDKNITCIAIEALRQRNELQQKQISSSLSSSSLSCIVWQQQKHNILQYIKIQDQYMIFISLLLKSYVYYYYLYYYDENDYDSKRVHEQQSQLLSNYNTWNSKPIVILPRTDYNQPYIPQLPQSTTITNTDSTLAYCHPFSISHQYPIVGLTIIQPPRPKQQPQPQQHLTACTTTTTSTKVYYLGIDIVIFDAHYNAKLYTNLYEYIHVYQDYFTYNEWSNIIQYNNDNDNTNNNYNMLYEFYIQWSIKEAYTKAFGLGMSINFQSFETNINTISYWKIKNNHNTNTNHNIKFNNSTNTNNDHHNDYTYIDNNDHQQQNESNHSLWEWIQNSFSSTTTSSLTSPSYEILCAIGTVTQLQHSSTTTKTTTKEQHIHQRPRQEMFYFYFYPIFYTCSSSNKNNKSNSNSSNSRIDETRNTNHNNIRGCATICYGPIPSPPTTTTTTTPTTHTFHTTIPKINVEWTNIQELISFHTGI